VVEVEYGTVTATFIGGMGQPMSVGRNDPCPCGSGRKYKKCCLQAAADSGDALYDRLRNCEGAVVDKLMRFARRAYGATALAEAAAEFRQDPPGAEEDPDPAVFIPWFVFDWVPAVRGPVRGATATAAPSLMDAYLREEGRSLSDMERTFIEAVRKEPFSFHEILEADAGNGVRARDILREVECRVTERSASGSLQRGDVVYARVAALSGVSIFEGIGSVVLRPSAKAEILELRRSLRDRAGTISTETLREASRALRETYHDLRRRELNRSLPILQNTDGDPLRFSTITYRVPSAQAAFMALRALAVGHTEDELLRGAEHDAEGRLRKIDFSWLKRGNKKHPTWDNTVLGHLVIEGDRLTIEVNSEKRARRIQTEIRKRLGDGAVLLKSETRSLEEAMAEAKREEKTPAGRRRRREHEAFERRPEVQALMQKQSDAHWDAWIQMKVPALGNRTPAEAIGDPDGREMVEALLTEFDRYDSKKRPGEPRADIPGLRRRLGLPTTT
jgi:hypothetical protein